MLRLAQIDLTMSAPTKAEREKCWGARDELWSCLDKNEEHQEKCKKQREIFEGSCTKQWVKYFNRRRDYLKYKDKIENDGFEPIKEKNS